MTFLPCVPLLVILYMVWRNELVYRTRMKVLFAPRADSVERYRRLPDYDTMLWHVWRFRWDVETPTADESGKLEER